MGESEGVLMSPADTSQALAEPGTPLGSGDKGGGGAGEETPPRSLVKSFMRSFTIRSPFSAWKRSGEGEGEEEGEGDREVADLSSASGPASASQSARTTAGANASPLAGAPSPGQYDAKDYLLTTHTAKLRWVKAQEKLEAMEKAAKERKAERDYALGDELPESHKKLMVTPKGQGAKSSANVRPVSARQPKLFRPKDKDPVGGDMLLELLEETTRLRGLMEDMESKMEVMAGEGERSRAKIMRLREERDALRVSLEGAAEAEGDSVHLAGELLEARRRIAHVEAERDSVELDCTDLVAEVRRLQAVAEGAEAELADAEAARARLELALEERTAEADALRGELRAARAGQSAGDSVGDSPVPRGRQDSAEVNEKLARRAVEGKIAELLKEQRLVRRRASAMNDRLH